MSEVIKDSAIKLFGRTISLPRNNEVSANGSSSDPQDCSHHSPPSSSSFPREVSSTTELEAERDKNLATVNGFVQNFHLFGSLLRGQLRLAAISHGCFEKLFV
ncbi:hypothetical protein CR513_30514, partial [Mucuna pruriens]